MASTVMVSKTITNVCEKLLPKDAELLLDPNKETHPLVAKGSLQLLAFCIRNFRGFQRNFKAYLQALKRDNDFQFQC